MAEREEKDGVGRAVAERSMAILLVAAFFHDFGKATVLFQDRMDKDERTAQEPVRHEFISAAVFDALLGDVADEDFADRLSFMTDDDFRRAWASVPRAVSEALSDPSAPLRFRFLARSGMVWDMGHLVLSHHRLPLLTPDRRPNGERMVRPDLMSEGDLGRMRPAPGEPFWKDAAMRQDVLAAARRLTPGPALSAPFLLRVCFCMADSTASSRARENPTRPAHAASRVAGQWGDSLGEHTRQVMDLGRDAFELVVGRRDDWPSMPPDRFPPWLNESFTPDLRTGGLFATVSSPDEAERLRAQMAIIAEGAMSDGASARRRLRLSLVSNAPKTEARRAKHLVKTLGFFAGDVMTYRDSPQALTPLPLAQGCPTAALAGFHAHLDRHGVLSPPVLVCSLDQIGKSASPQYSKDLTTSLRMMNSDIAVDGADALDDRGREVLERLMWQAGASGRRAVISGDGVPDDLTARAREAYEAGWREHAALCGADPFVKVIVDGDDDPGLTMS